MKLNDYVVMARRRWVLILICGALGLALGLYFAVSAASKSEAEAQVYIAVSGPNSVEASTIAELEGINLPKRAAERYSEIVDSAAILEPAAHQITAEVTQKELSNRIDFEVAKSAPVMTLRAFASSPEEALEVVDAVTNSLVDFVNSGELEGDVIQSLTPVATILAPSRIVEQTRLVVILLPVLAGLLVGLIFGGCLAVATLMGKRTVDEPLDLEQLVPVHVLGEKVTSSWDASQLALELAYLSVALGGNRFLVSSVSGTGVPEFVFGLAETLSDQGNIVSVVVVDASDDQKQRGMAADGAVSRSTNEKTLEFRSLFTTATNSAALVDSDGDEVRINDVSPGADFSLVVAPPVFQSAFAAAAGSECAAVLLSVEAGTTPVAKVREAKRAFENSGCTVAGAVLLGDDRRA